MASESGQQNEVEIAEKPRDGESWRGMVERQQKEGTNLGGYSRELLRSLPAEQKQDKDQRGRGSLDEAPNTVVAEGLHPDFQQLLRDASQRAGQHQDKG